MSACSAQPISWLELERHALGELSAGRAAGVDAHLHACAVCRACMERIRGDRRELPRLVVPAAAPPRPLWSRWRIAWALTGAALAAALVLLLLRPRGSEPELAGLPPPRLKVKGGGELVIELVRERNGEVTHEPRGYRDGDRFQVMVSCQRGGPLEAELVVFEGGQAHFPGPRQPLECGNRVVMPAAFALTGTGARPVIVCASFAALDRARIATAADLPRDTTACIRLAPE